MMLRPLKWHKWHFCNLLNYLTNNSREREGEKNRRCDKRLMKANANQGPYEASHKARNDMVRAEQYHNISQLHAKLQIENDPHIYFTAWSNIRLHASPRNDIIPMFNQLPIFSAVLTLTTRQWHTTGDSQSACHKPLDFNSGFSMNDHQPATNE